MIRRKKLEQLEKLVTTQASVPNFIWQLKVTLRNSRPPIWRRLLVPGSTTLQWLHWTLQDAMGWMNSHLHHFIVGESFYGEPDPEHAVDMLDEREWKLSQVAPKAGALFVYEYDFGDSWIHDIFVEQILPAEKETRYPLCLDGKRACPPEDCGGVGGYENLLEILRNPEHEEYESMREWLGRPVDPEAIDLKAINRILPLGRRGPRS